jgi:hypothetical protein
MTNPTSNFGWQMPTPTDLVTDLPADFEVFGQAVDTSLADLQGGTTGQILAKATNADMDFTWITNDVGDITAVNVTSPITGGGSSGAVTIAIQDATTSVKGAVQLSDSTSTTSSVLASTPTATKSAYDLAASAYAPAFTNNFYAGKNKIINGDFGIWQRGTTFSFTGGGGYAADRWEIAPSGGAMTVSQQTFTPGTAPVAGYEGTFFMRMVCTTADDNWGGDQKIENVRSFAGQTITISFWAKADSARTLNVYTSQNFGSGGSTAVSTTQDTKTLSTSWQRFTSTVAIASVAGKTIGTSSFLQILFRHPVNSTGTVDIWGVQVEAGSVATPFQTASGSIAGELALCQRYYFRENFDAQSSFGIFASGSAASTTIANFVQPFPVTMRVKPAVLDFPTVSTNFNVVDAAGNSSAGVTITIDGNQTTSFQGFFNATTAATLTQFRPYVLRGNNTTGAYLGWSSEL